jgi:cytochrome c oxidase subunit III
MSTVASQPHAVPVHKDYEGAKLGMWLFLFTEILLFGGLFVLYSVYRSRYPLDFHNCGQMLDTFIGVTNTVILLTSSLTVAVAITALQRGNRRLTLLCLGATIVFGFSFLANKYMEWSSEIRHGRYPNSPELLARPDGEKIFFGLYYTMTGLHGLHVIAGIVVLSFMFDFVRRNKVTTADFTKLENGGLYWHLVDVIWIFLLPLFYLSA